MLIAHSRNSAGDWHPLDEHLAKVARLAAEFSATWNDPFWARLAGAWHDLGKARPGFQRHVQQDRDAHIEGRIRSNDKTHSAAGALHARAEFVRIIGSPAAAALARPLEYLIAGHHAGLADWQPDTHEGLATRLAHTNAQAEHREAIHALAQANTTPAAPLDATTLMAEARRWSQDNKNGLPLGRALGLRMLFSALVDADFLDTERHFDDGKAARRGAFPSIAEYAARLGAHLDAKAAEVQAQGRADDPIMRARGDVLAACRAKAELPPGVFSLTVPTGGGKTLSSLAFALDHARQHGLRRVVYAIPYTSIIEQTASVFAGIFGAENVLEHHSQAQERDERETTATRLAAENWDAPLIVTTNVQLFESLFAARTSQCRKLHRLAGSVIVLDEAQMLPPAFLQPILDALNVLLARFRISLVLCTATQPVLTDSGHPDIRKRLRGLPAAQPIIDTPEPLFDRLRRTHIHWPRDLSTPTELPDLAERLQAERCALAIVNTRQDAMDLARLLPRESTLHLSAAMCGAHRADVLAELRHRLAHRGDQPLHLIATQLIEAGVDVDFPVVFRALAGLDSIAQAAGRCNREGRLDAPGAVHVFVRPIPKPLALLRSAAETTVSLHAAGLPDALAPTAFERYFQLFYSRQPQLDAKGIVGLLEDRDTKFEFSFRTAADNFKLIDDAGQEAVIVPLHEVPGIGGSHQALAPLIQQLQSGATDRWLLRKLQRYTLNVHAHQFKALERDLAPLPGGGYLLTDVTRYDPRFGLLSGSHPLDAMSLVQ
ncbi:CRISPR-associated helicase/endonuclease Cas3 [Pelomonas sp. Root1444]|uniref:CRISPR-associated helicase/endonuclease Cas3 n=1 Tax=Pelomonas sp. Root1444 TaxID=1736464 RepID=UPI00070261C0|nr:CRISPR-associated helicase/endonuclease Cas3 [Pelomonas sp. Root1444]KQY89089.1 hypothetical protein ASD35_16415 [Pelomonas sp. Root1444]